MASDIGGKIVKKAEADKIALQIFEDAARKTKVARDRLFASGWIPHGLDGESHPELKAIDDECRRKIQELAAQIED